jgi:hypothetical protein
MTVYLQVPVVVESSTGKAQPRLHVLLRHDHVQEDSGCEDPSSMPWVRADFAERFVCVVMLTRVPADGCAYTLLRRADGMAEKLVFPAGVCM